MACIREYDYVCFRQYGFNACDLHDSGLSADLQESLGQEIHQLLFDCSYVFQRRPDSQFLADYKTWSLFQPACADFAHLFFNLVYYPDRSYFSSLPETLREAAKIDGANNYQILLQIYLPMSKAILAVIAVYTIVGVWNSWFYASVYLPTTTWQPLQLYLRRVLIQMTVDLTKDLGKEACRGSC